MKQKIAVIIGSTRKDSINKKLAGALEKLGADKFEFTNVAIDKLPLFNQDLESEKPKEVLAFVEEIKKFNAVLIVTPEHNRSIPAALKNAIDWGTRPAVGGNIWKDMAVATAGTSPGGIGTALAQEHLRHIFLCYGRVVMGGELYLQMKEGLIDDAFNVTNEDTKKFLQGYIDRLAAFTSKEAAPSKMAA
ncbi:MAG: ACP phosphodiesterase [Micavibrio aeruginosavorus]|uniref:ACP phosphodiesterase n=1 Tax=Micavibrio aeruginosavorus TaxID=349221 RepID=A0A2W5Q8X7_9BACT|nr:MAG: ACP phosphodiesterase [Micavibrio aeruginosavorus]